MNQDSEPFIPVATDDEEEVFEEDNIVEKQKTVEKLYHYYNFLLLDQNRERLLAHPEEYANLERAVKE